MAGMKPIDIIERLKFSDAPDRLLDRDIAILDGYKRRVRSDNKPEWYKDGVEEVGIPRYTRFIDDARSFALHVDPDHVAACKWDNGFGEAQINDGPRIKAATPAIALCIAALNILAVTNADAH